MKPTSEIPPGTIVVCAPKDQPAYFADDSFATCEACGTEIRHRPHIPAHARKVCIGCAVKVAETAAASGKPLKARITEQTARDIALYFSGGTKQ